MATKKIRSTFWITLKTCGHRRIVNHEQYNAGKVFCGRCEKSRVIKKHLAKAKKVAV